MNQMKKNTLLLLLVLFTLLAGAGGFFIGRTQAPLPAPPASKALSAAPPATAVGQHEESHHDHESDLARPHDSADDHDHAAGHDDEPSDLDRTVADMWSARCEHDILHYQCDECRYELGVVKLAPELVAEHGLVGTGFPEMRPSRHEERTLPGEVEFNESRTVHVASPLSGMITKGFTTPGARVEAGTPLFVVDSPEVAEAKGSYLKARAGLDLARKAAAREALLFTRKVAAEVEVQEAEARRTEAEAEMAAARGRLLRLGLSGADLDSISATGNAALNGLVTIRASRNGTVIEGHATPGEHAEAGRELLTISDLTQVWVMADLKEPDLAAVSAVDGVDAMVLAQGHELPARLDIVSGRMSHESRTAKARFSVENAAGLLKPGMFVSVRVLLPAPGETLVVPKVAVLADEGRTFLFTHQEGDYWIRRPVTLGQRYADLVEITSGITADQRIITDGSFLLKSDVLRGKMGAGCAD